MKSDNIIILLIVICILVLLLLLSAIRLLQYKRQIRSFVIMTRERQDIEMNRPISVDYFDKDILELASVLNEYTDLQKEIAVQCTKDKKKFHTVIAGISHDFRTPLTAAKGYMQLIEQNDKLEKQDRMYLRIAIEKMNYLKHLSDEFFEIASLEAKEDVEKTKVHLNKLLYECILSQYDWIERRGLAVHFEIPEKDIFIMTNAHFLTRVIENLFSNVKKYAKSEVCFCVRESERGLVIRMENDTDSGNTIALNQVFEPFYRDKSGHSLGSGLGLYVVKCLADKLGYGISAECGKRTFAIQLFLSD